MPPKPKTTTRNAPANKKKAGPPKLENPSNNETTSGLSQEAEDQFELELCWCIQQLELCIASGKLQEKQAHDLTKNVNILRSNTAPLIKKRQVMRSTLGNYREKMAQDEQKFLKNASSVKFTTTVPKQKSLFLKKAIPKATEEKKNVEKDILKEKSITKSDGDLETVENTFKFNFKIVE